MNDNRAHSVHSAVEQTRPGAETDEQSEPFHPVCLEAETRKTNMHAHDNTSRPTKRLSSFSFIVRLIDYPVLEGH